MALGTDRALRLYGLVLFWCVSMVVAAHGARQGSVDTAVERTAAEARWRRGLGHGYNLDHAEALAIFEEAIAIDPNDATAHRLAAATIWTQLLFHQGAITVEDYLGQARAKVARRTPPRDLVNAFNTHVDQAIALGERLVRDNPSDPDAHFQLGAAAALRASYIATIEGRVFDSLGSGRRAYSAHKRTIALDPSRKDAGLIVGMYRYTVANLSLPKRFMARLAGFDGGRASGLTLVEEAARSPSKAQTNALLTLMLMCNREGRYDDALRIARQLQEMYPRNRLFWLEAGSTALRAGRAAEALRELDEGLARFGRDPRPKAYREAEQWEAARDRARSLVASTQRQKEEIR
jgi:tetratricopeptide (TPR) repeat protein